MKKNGKIILESSPAEKSGELYRHYCTAVRFSKIYDYGTVRWSREGRARQYRSKQELIQKLGLKNVKKVDKDFFINSKGTKYIIPIYEGERES